MSPILYLEEFYYKREAGKPMLGTETVSWVCIVAAFPFAAIGFIRYNGMSAEQFIYAWFTSEVLTSKKLTFKNNNMYYLLLENVLENTFFPRRLRARQIIHKLFNRVLSGLQQVRLGRDKK